MTHPTHRLVVAIKSKDGEPQEVVRISRVLFDDLDNGMVGYPAVYTVDGDKLLFHPKPLPTVEIMARVELAD